jgi:hypothetical protein
MFSDENVGDTLKSFAPKIDGWIKDLLGGFEELNLTRSQKELIRALTVETMLYNNIMSNEEIIAILSDIIRNIATRHAYGNPLDWWGRGNYSSNPLEKHVRFERIRHYDFHN